MSGRRVVRSRARYRQRDVRGVGQWRSADASAGRRAVGSRPAARRLSVCGEYYCAFRKVRAEHVACRTTVPFGENSGGVMAYARLRIDKYLEGEPLTGGAIVDVRRLDNGGGAGARVKRATVPMGTSGAESR